MKKLPAIILLLTLAFTSFAQLQDQLQDTRRTVFWLKLNLAYVRDPQIKAYKYETRLINDRIYVGNLEEFQQQVWKGRAAGNFIVEGPFSFREQAELAKRVFSPKATKDTSILNDTKTYYWYLVRLGRYQRLNSYKFEHIPAAVAEGTLKEFLATLETAKYNSSIVIGPFQTRVEAELSKRMFRQEE